MSKPSPLKVFITYSHKNALEKDELIICLATMKDDKDIDIWHDAETTAGNKFRETIPERLIESDILLYLVSRYSLASESCKKELMEALERGKEVIPIILEDCDWEAARRLSGFKALPDDGQAINEWTPESKGWQNVVERYPKNR